MLTELSALLDLFKAKGVTHARLEPWAFPPSDAFAKCGVIDVTFAPVVAALPESEDAKPQDMCRCGHHLAEHQGGACMHGCDDEKCA